MISRKLAYSPVGIVQGSNAFSISPEDPLLQLSLTSPSVAAGYGGFTSDYQRQLLAKVSRNLYRYNSLYRVLIDTVTQLVVSDGLRPNFDYIESIRKRKKLEALPLKGTAGESHIELQAKIFREYLLTGESLAVVKGDKVLVLGTERIKDIIYDQDTGAVLGVVIKNTGGEYKITDGFAILINAVDVQDLRGTPRYSSIFPMIHRINDVLDAEALNCSISARILAARYRPDGPELLHKEQSQGEMNPLEIQELDYAVIFELDPKERIEYLKREFPNNFAEIINMYIRFISACAGLPMEYLMKNLQDLNFSSSRMMFRLLQGQILYFQNLFFDKVISPLYQIITGYPPTGYIVSPTTIVDDLREVQAVVEKVNGGLISKTTAAAELGYNYEEELFLMQNETAKMNEENTQE
jgi:hypothetical protein